MPKYSFSIVDVFAESKYAGNPLAVFKNAQDLSSEDMQKITREINFSETTFILSDQPRAGGYDVRIFTPGCEVPFAGHPTLGTAAVIRDEIIRSQVERVNLNLKVGQIPVTFGRRGEPDVLSMRQNPPEFGPTINAGEIAPILGLEPSDFDTRVPVQEVSTGMWFIIVPLASLEAIRKARVNRDRYFSFIADRQAKGILTFCPKTYSWQNHLNVRVFVPFYGVEEDPATGSGNGCLAGYLVRNRYFGGGEIDICVEQGCEIGRPARIYLQGKEENGTITVHVGGKVIPIARGEFI
jgi:trans-2,3-dihydro-3-hydroxyanthranilate isomerase